MEDKFYKKEWFMWLMLFVFAPIGIYLMWKEDYLNKTGKVAATFLFILAFIFELEWYTQFKGLQEILYMGIYIFLNFLIVKGVNYIPIAINKSKTETKSSYIATKEKAKPKINFGDEAKRNNIIKTIASTVVIIIFLIVLWHIIPSSNNTNKQTSSTETVQTSEQKFKFSGADLTEDNIKKAMLQVQYVDLKDIISVKVYDGNKIKINFDIEGQSNEKRLMEASASEFTEISEVLFKNPGVGSIDFWVNTGMEDGKGNISKQPVIEFVLSSKNEYNINWNNFKDLVYKDYKNLLKVVDSYYIAPAISNKLN